MCWSILYHENKISMEKSMMDYSIYKKINILENFDYIFEINKITIKEKLLYSITHNQCACDFFKKKKYKFKGRIYKIYFKKNGNIMY